MMPDPSKGRRSKVVIISAISSVQVLGNHALSNVIRAAWAAEAKTMAFAEEVSAAVEGLLSEFSDHITGVNITCDGGFTRAY
jgi:enoyl-[acyl-carrier-protein] reductase (NADH)